MTRLVILDPCLTIVSSHNYSEACALVREAGELHLPIEIYGHMLCSSAVQELPAQRFFRQSGYSHILAAKLAADFLATTFCNQATLQDLSRLNAQLTAEDFVFFPTVTGNIILAICKWLGSFTTENAPSFGMCLMFPHDTNTVGTQSLIVREHYERAFALIPPALKTRLVYTCETAALTEIYEPILGTRPITLSLPTWSASPPKTPGRSETFRISFLGDGRLEKGFALLPDIINTVLSQRPDVCFTVQAVGNDKELVDSVARHLSDRSDAVTVIRGSLNGAQLFSALRNSDVLLLPYDADKYRVRGSSLFTEAKAIGVPMVLPRGTSVGDEGQRRGVAELFDEFTAESIAGAVVRAIDRREQLSQAAEREAESHRLGHTGYLAVLLRRVGLLS